MALQPCAALLAPSDWVTAAFYAGLGMMKVLLVLRAVYRVLRRKFRNYLGAVSDCEPWR